MSRLSAHLKLPRKADLLNLLSMLSAAALVASCDSPSRSAWRELNRDGVEISGRSLLDAVIRGDHLDCARLLECKVHIEARDARGRTALGIATEAGDLDTLAMLLNAGAEPNTTHGPRGSILGQAIASGEPSIISALIANGARTDGLMPDGDPILTWAIRNGRLDIVKNLIESGADPHLMDAHGNPLLHLSIASRHRHLAESLIELGADPGATNASGQSTLDLAIANGWLDFLPKLAAAGADPNAPGPEGLTLLEQAYHKKDTDRMVLLIKIGADPYFSVPGSGRSPIFDQMFEAGDLEGMEHLMRYSKAPLGGWDSWLWRAVERGELKAARLFMTHGARPVSPATGGLLAVEWAVQKRSADFLKLFLDYGLPTGRSFDWCLARGDHEMAGLLLAGGVSPEKSWPPSRATPLGLAIANGHDRFAALLIRHGADVNVILPEGQTALHLAVAKGCGHTVQAILDQGADPNAPFLLPVSAEFIRHVRPGIMRWSLTRDRGTSLLMMASDSGNIATTRSLISAGARMHVRTKSSSLWPINFASRRGDIPMMRLFLGQDPHREERWIEVRLNEQRARVFDGAGQELFSTKVSTGKRGHGTPTGEFVITNKHRYWTSTIYHSSMPFFQRLSCSDFGLHQGNVPGYPASHGCIRVPAGNAAKLFELTETGDRVRIIP